MHLLRANFPLNLGINNEQQSTTSCMNLVRVKWLQGNALFHALLCEQSRSQKRSTVLWLGSSEPGHSIPPSSPQLTAASQPGWSRHHSSQCCNHVTGFPFHILPSPLLSPRQHEKPCRCSQQCDESTQALQCLWQWWTQNGGTEGAMWSRS